VTAEALPLRRWPRRVVVVVRRVVEAGTFTVFTGGSSEDVQSAQFEVSAGAKLPGLGSAIPRFMR